MDSHREGIKLKAATPANGTRLVDYKGFFKF